ncbi:MAG: MATE family efflux transporter [Oceanospirillaceae bacterium]|nr:MATE family efflux transporter [Oceanospirillaceae bacterium]MCP5350219.1 MATE family efflux transporter [Oceanospirillaceae bacterium]
MVKNLVTGEIRPVLIQLTLPMVYGIVAIFLFNLVDTYFVSLLGTDYLAAISFTFPVTMTVMNLAIGLSIAVGSVVARAIGQKNHAEAVAWIGKTFYLSLAIGLLTAIIGITCADGLFAAMGAEPQIIPLIKQYLLWWFAGCVLLIIMIVLNATLRATGNTKLPSKIMMLSAALNGIFDPLLIFGWGPVPALGMQGAAIATVISWLVGFVFLMRVLIKQDLLDFHLPANLLQGWGRLLALGIPASLTNMLGPLANGILLTAVAGLGTHAVAAFGVGARLEPLMLIVVLALTASLPPFVGQNFGAGEHGRIFQGLKSAMGFISGWQAGVYVLMAVLAFPLSWIFSDDAQVQAYIRLFLWIVPITYMGMGFSLMVNSVLNALQKPQLSLLISLTRLFIFYVPLGYAGSQLAGLPGLFIGCALAHILTGVLISLLVARSEVNSAWREWLFRAG